MPPVNVLIKPASSKCNLRCSYCFYHDEASKRSTESYGIMQMNTAEAIIKKALEYASDRCEFVFQGGEPALAGLDFFKSFVELEKRYNKNNLKVHNAIQTNGTLIYEDWALFFAEENFLVGVSLDGHESLHDLYRKDASGKGTFAPVMNAIDTLKRYNVEFNVLTVVTAQTAKNIRQTYAFFMKNKLVYQQYIPCLDPIGLQRGGCKYSLTPELYAKFLKSLFDVWYEDREAGRFVYNDYFENFAGMLLGYEPQRCDMTGVCSVQYAIEANGNVYPCDFYMLDSYIIGNINTDEIETIEKNRASLGFIRQSAVLPEQCLKCRWLRICRGGCRRNRIQTVDTDSGLNYFCKAYQEFYPYSLGRLAKLVGFKENISLNM